MPRGEDAQNLRFKVEMPGKEKENQLASTRKRPLTQKTIASWIKQQSYDDWTKTELIKLANTYPDTALPAFEKNFNLMVARVQKKRNK